MPSPTQAVVVIGSGQSGLAGARAVREAGLHPVVLEAEDRPSGSWPKYYDSLTLFSPARYSSLPDFPMPGDPDRYPTRDEVAEYLESYAAHLDVEIKTNSPVRDIQTAHGGFAVTTDQEVISAAGVIAASGSFGTPYVPSISGQTDFAGEQLHVADYRNPKPYVGMRVVVVGAGNSAVQVAYELAEVASVTLATLEPLSFLPQRIHGHDMHYWLAETGFDKLPAAWLSKLVTSPLVMDTGGYREAVESGRIQRRPMFSEFDEHAVVWPDGTGEEVDVVVYGTGYRPNLGYLASLGALSPEGMPLHEGGISTTHLGLVYLGLEFQRSFASNTVRGISREADHVVSVLAAYVRGAHAAIGL